MGTPEKRMAKKHSKKSTKLVSVDKMVNGQSVGTLAGEETGLKKQPQPEDQPAKVGEVPTPPVCRKVPVSFVLPEPNANRVSLSGEFNGWQPDTTPMKRNANGRWETSLSLVPGRYQYKFVVDGQWIPDPLAEENVLNPHGTLNSVIEVVKA
jgi:hypothetical protein